MTERLGYIGLGVMGKAMARNLLQAGYSVTVHNRSRAAVEELAAEGARAADSPRQVAEASDIVFTNLPDSPDVAQVVLGPQGVIEASRGGMLLVDNSTISPGTACHISAALAERGVAALDAPVSGGELGAKAGTLSIMVGGPTRAFERALPILRSLGKTITHVGESGAGQVAKACNQLMVSAQMVAMGELLLLAQRAGVDPRRVLQAIRGGAAQCWTLDNKAARLLSGDRRPGFRADLMHKDLGIVLDTARRHGVPLPQTAIGAQLYQAMLQLDMRQLDNSAVIGVLEAMAGEALRTSEGPD
jgi:2-hydroxy-3-oxopropionate reductase